MSPEDSARRQLQVLSETIDARNLESVSDDFVQSALHMIEIVQFKGILPKAVIAGLRFLETYTQLREAVSNDKYDLIDAEQTKDGYPLVSETDKGWHEIHLLAVACQTRIDRLRS